MHLRRALLLFALVLGLTALATAVTPTQNASEPGAVPAPPPPPAAAGGGAVMLSLGPVGPHSRRPAERVAAGRQVILTVHAAQAGLVAIPGLGRIATVTPDTPAVFDLVAPSPGRYEIALMPAGGGAAQRVGTLVTTA